MTIITGIDPSKLTPGSAHVINYLQGGRSLTSLPQRLLLIGVQSAAATATPGVIIPVDDPTTTAGQFGMGSYMDLMCQKAFSQAQALGQGPALYACPLAETTTKRVMTITIAGTATEDRNLTIRIAGRYITIGVSNGAVQNAIATALNTKIGEFKQTLPFTATVATNVVTLTDVCKGTLGNDVLVTVVSTPAGVTVTPVQTVAGAGAIDIQTALDAAAAQDFDGVVCPDHVTGNITEIMTHIAATWAPTEKKPRWFFIGEPGSIGTATTLASAANHEGVVVLCFEQSPSLPCEIATAAAVAALSKTRPNANYDGQKLQLYPPPIAYNFTTQERETALQAGVTPLVSVVDNTTRTVIEGVALIVRLVTTRTSVLLQSVQVPFVLLRDFGISRTAWAMARQYDLAFAAEFGADANQDGILDDDDTIKRIREMVISIGYAAEDQRWIHNYDDSVPKLLVEDNPSALGEIDVDSPYNITVGLHRVIYVHRATVGG